MLQLLKKARKTEQKKAKSTKAELQELLGSTQLVRIDTPIKLIVDPDNTKK